EQIVWWKDTPKRHEPFFSPLGMSGVNRGQQTCLFHNASLTELTECRLNSWGKSTGQVIPVDGHHTSSKQILHRNRVPISPRSHMLSPVLGKVESDTQGNLVILRV